MKLNHIIKATLVGTAASVLLGCAVVPKDLDNSLANDDDDFIRMVMSDTAESEMWETIEKNHSTTPKNLSSTVYFSQGDWLKLKLHNMPDYNGVYQINSSGHLELPFGPTPTIAGLSREQAVDLIETELKNAGWFIHSHGTVDLSLVRFASIRVAISGAVFNPGSATINVKPALKQQDAILQAAGAYAEDRSLVAALVAAGGVRPDADLTRVTIKRKNLIYSVDLSSLINGATYISTPFLIHGDEVYVPSYGMENNNLIRPTQITPPGMRILMSNLTAPALNNALSAVGADATRLPYGSSVLDAALSANCVGGTHQANASRSILLVTRHHGSNQQIVIRRRINQLLAASSDVSINPFLMPNDGVACYDSRFTNIRDVARGLGEVFGPILLGRLL